ncbi:MAG: glycosyltransferase [Candidatus Magasanikbacteria bacterium]|nr:glycosyltransferase [Candidatus Magasanikbacteria bacterium]
MSCLVSVIIPTKNSSEFLEKCLESLKNQTYKNIEIIVVDNNSVDSTKEIAEAFKQSTLELYKLYNFQLLNWGPERSAQVNFGVKNSNGEYVYKVDSDFILDKEVIDQCVKKANEGFGAVVVHNSPDVRISWIAHIRKFEVDMYKYDITHSSARFVRKEVYEKIGEFNEKITAGEDYDFQNKLNRGGFKTGFIEAEALHLGEPTNFWKHMKKYYDYGKDFVKYKQENISESKKQLGFFRSVYFKNWKKFIYHPMLGSGFIMYNFFKFAFGGAGYLVNKIKKI